ncbi:hypothetical protein K449DRAFT_426875 [Hypoxylon sp. EC38]|nr:hypothetical protein K449DRAFT_426875 [Hypoxylon sp. EC38]
MAVISGLSITSAPSLPQPTSDGGLGVREDTLLTLTVARESSTCVTVIQLGKTQDEGNEATAACCTGETVVSTPSVVPTPVQDSAPTPSSSSDNSSNTALIILGAGGSAAEGPLQNPFLALRKTVTLTIRQSIPPLHIQYPITLQSRVENVGRRDSRPIAARLGFRDPQGPLDLQDQKGRRGRKGHQDKLAYVALQVLQEDLRVHKVHKDCKVHRACRVPVAGKDPAVPWDLKVFPASALWVHKVQWVRKGPMAPLVDRGDLLGRKDYRDYKGPLGHLGIRDLRDLQEDHRDRKVRRALKVITVPWVLRALPVVRQDLKDHKDLSGLAGRRDNRDLPADHRDLLGHMDPRARKDRLVPKVQEVIQVDHKDHKGYKGRLELLEPPELPELPARLGLLGLLDLQGLPETLALLYLVRGVLRVLKVLPARPVHRVQCNAVSNAGIRAGTPASVAAEQGTHVAAIVAASVAVAIKTYTYNERYLHRYLCIRPSFGSFYTCVSHQRAINIHLHWGDKRSFCV